VKQLTLLKFVYVLLLIPFVVYPAFAVEYDQIVLTSRGTVDVGIYTIPEVPNIVEPTKLKISFLKPGTDRIQEHIDYRVNVTKDGDYVFGPMLRLTHTSPGDATIPVQFSENGLHQVNIEVEGILFSPIPLETASLTMNIGQEETSIPAEEKKGGGCLIATAAFGSEMAPQVQFLREIRDNTVLQTESGSAFMTGFNQFYYSFSPAVADYERENPAFKETVKLALTPMLTSLAILNYVDIDSEAEMLGYGIGIILLNIGMYFVAPAIIIIKIKNRN